MQHLQYVQYTMANHVISSVYAHELVKGIQLIDQGYLIYVLPSWFDVHKKAFFSLSTKKKKKEMTLLYLMIATLLYLMIATLLYIMIATNMGYLWSCDINIAKLRKIWRMQIMRMETTNKQERMSLASSVSLYGVIYTMNYDNGSLLSY